MPQNPLQKIWEILSDPSNFFSKLKEQSAMPALIWLACGTAIFLFVGGPLSVILSVIAGVPFDVMLGFLTKMPPGYLAGAVYLIGLIGTLILFMVVYLISALIAYALVWALGGKPDFQKSIQLIAYTSTPDFIALTIPQVLLMDTITLSPTTKVGAFSYNYCIDFVQFAAMAYSAYLTYVACKTLFKLSPTKSVLFIAIPLACLVALYIGIVILSMIFVP